MQDQLVTQIGGLVSNTAHYFARLLYGWENSCFSFVYACSCDASGPLKHNGHARKFPGTAIAGAKRRDEDGDEEDEEWISAGRNLQSRAYAYCSRLTWAVGTLQQSALFFASAIKRHSAGAHAW